MRLGIRELIFLAVLLAVPLASYLYVFKPRNEEIGQAKREVEIKQAKLNQLREVSTRIEDIGIAIQQGQDAIQVIENKLPSEQDVEVILEDIWKLAKKERLSVKSVKSEKQVKYVTYMELPLRVTMEGSFNGFYQFLLDLEKLPRITRIRQLKIQRTSVSGGSGSSGGKGAIKTEFILSIYFVSHT